MRTVWALCLPMALAGCNLPECGTGFKLAGHGGCEIDRPAACPSGQVRVISGECVEPYGEVNPGANPVDTDVQTDTDGDSGLGGDTGGRDTDGEGPDTDETQQPSDTAPTGTADTGRRPF